MSAAHPIGRPSARVTGSARAASPVARLRPAAIGALPVEPVEDSRSRDTSGALQPVRVAGAGDDAQLGVGDALGDQPGVGDRRHRVALAVQHERRRLDLVQPRHGVVVDAGQQVADAPCGGARCAAK